MRAVHAVKAPIGEALLSAVRPYCQSLEPPVVGPLPRFAVALMDQPRAGATRPGRPRLALMPSESHAEHCWVVAVGAVLAAQREGANPTVPFLAGLTHHLHNAVLPDSGFAGESLIAEHLADVQTELRTAALAELQPDLRSRVASILEEIVRAGTPEARAFHTADVLDRVLEMKWHARTAGFTLQEALVELELVHEGPLQTFGDDVVAAAGLT